MSFYRLIYYSALVCGWAAFAAWLLCEPLAQSAAASPAVKAAGSFAAVGGLIGAGLATAGSLGSFTVGGWLKRVAAGGVGGLVLGAAVGLPADLLFARGLPQAVAWMAVGLGIGALEGLLDRSAAKLRNGLIGGAVGGLVGGAMFGPIGGALGSDGMAARAVGYVIMGLSVGLLIGLVQVVLRDAWLTVLDGYGPGRQYILSRPTVPLGRGDHTPLPFGGPANRDLLAEHAVLRREGRGFVVEPAAGATGVRVNADTITAPRALRDGDLIRLGANVVRFNERGGGGGAGPAVNPAAAVGRPAVPPPPPPPVPRPMPAAPVAPTGRVAPAVAPAVVPPREPVAARVAPPPPPARGPAAPPPPPARAPVAAPLAPPPPRVPVAPPPPPGRPPAPPARQGGPPPPPPPPPPRRP